MSPTSRALSALALAAAASALASPALAGFPDIGFVGTLGGTLTPVESFNSTGGANSVAIVGTGLFQVTLPGLGNGLDSNVQVNASNTNGTPHICTSQGWGSSNGVDVFANVACFDFSGNPYSGDFTLFYQARSSAPGGWLGYLWANQPTTASYTPSADYNYNNTGGTNTVTRQSAGVYTATFPGLRAGGNPQVTAYAFSGGASARCTISDWTAGKATTTQIGVRCFDGHGLPADEYFSLAYNRSTLEGEGEMNGVYAFANNPKKRSYTPKDYYSETGGSYPTATRFGKPEGQYSLVISNASGQSPLPILGMVTAIGTQGEYCEVEGYDDVGGGPFDMNLVCYDNEERQVNMTYSAEMFFRLP